MSLFLEELRLKPQVFTIANAAIKMTGPDAQNYLKSQTTNNVLKLEADHFQFNTILDISGKIISTFILCKKSEAEFYLLLQKEDLDRTFDRIEKYHITEDFEVEKLEQSYILKTNSKEKGFKGTYFFEYDVIGLGTCEDDQINYNLLKILTGVPELGLEAQVGELINNTRFDELAVDYTKGCYPGQETVAKIHTRRGAAFKPVLLILEGEFQIPKEKITQQDKKIGEVRNSLVYQNKTYLYGILNREKRIDHLSLDFEVENQAYQGVVHYYPYLSPFKKDLAVDLYDYAVELFQNGDDKNAIHYFQKAIEIDSRFEDAYESLGVLYGRLEDFDQAISIMNELKELNPKCMMALTNLSMFHMKKGEIETAEKYKADATLLNFQLLGDQAKQKRAQAELEEKRQADIKRRESMFKQVIEMDPEDAMANNGMGEIELDRGHYEQAATYFKAAIEADKKYSVAYLGLAKSYYQLQMQEELKEILLLGIEIASKNGDLMPANEMQAMLVKKI